MKRDFNIGEYVPGFRNFFLEVDLHDPWKFLRHFHDIITKKIGTLNSDFTITGNVAIHKTAIVEPGAIIKGPAIIAANTFIASYAYLRGGVFVSEHCIIGPGVEIKSSSILARTNIAHFNFIGDSIIGENVNMEAGAVIANHYNERTDKKISITIGGMSFPIAAKKFGAIVGDNSRIGANAVLSPGTILPAGTVVARLALIEQNPI
jgi:UDP-N-acetylglucosamine diphosphorylase / glucose-1-phosphate thymidylyltransferase / UDP-N-acetylgalactosamine diphosphorylase / glucosamine-1-phosphate N-acetyltransferase / galactosamine-1-phosphate N-acetyltransferase